MNKQLLRDLIYKLNNIGTYFIYQITDEEYTIVSREKKIELMLYYNASPHEFYRLNLSNLEAVKGKYSCFLIWEGVIKCQYLKKKKEYQLMNS